MFWKFQANTSNFNYICFILPCFTLAVFFCSITSSYSPFSLTRLFTYRFIVNSSYPLWATELLPMHVKYPFVLLLFVQLHLLWLPHFTYTRVCKESSYRYWQYEICCRFFFFLEMCNNVRKKCVFFFKLRTVKLFD